MAKITFNPNQPIQSLSGTLGCNTFRTRNGRTFMYRNIDPVLPKNPTPQQREKFRQQTIVDFCLSIVQKRISDIQEAMNMRKKLRDRIMRLYKRLAPTIKSNVKLRLKILSEYDRNFCESEPNHSRGNPEPIPSQSRPVLCSKIVTFVRVQS